MAGFDINFTFLSAQTGGAKSPGLCILRAEDFNIMQTRSPSIIALPQQNAGGRGHSGHSGTGVPLNIGMDFGIMQEQLKISGKIMDEDMLDIGGNIGLFISRFRTQWVEQPTVIIQTANRNQVGLIKVGVRMQPSDGSDAEWFCMSMRSSFGRPAGQTYWTYDLLLGVVFYPFPPVGS